MKILVLGSSGQIGAPTCKYLRDKGHEVVEWDIENSKYQDLRFYNHGLYNTMKDCDFVYYFASDVGGAKYLEDNEHKFNFINNNMKIMSYTFEALKTLNKPFIFTSSQMSELNHSTYGTLKKIGETITNDIGGLVVRLWNVYGMEHHGEKSHVITDFCKMAKYDGVIKMRTSGLESRQFLYAEDCAECLLRLTECYDILDKRKNYHITSFKWITILDIANTLSKLFSCDVQPGVKIDNTQKNAMNEPDSYILNFWKPKTTIEEGISKIYNLC